MRGEDFGGGNNLRQDAYSVDGVVHRLLAVARVHHRAGFFRDESAGVLRGAMPNGWKSEPRNSTQGQSACIRSIRIAAALTLSFCAQVATCIDYPG